MKVFSRWLLGLFLFLFFVIPLSNLVLTAFTSKPLPLIERLTTLQWPLLVQELNDRVSLNPVRELFTVKRYRRAAFNSLWLAVIVATLSSALAAPISWAFARGYFWRQATAQQMALLPLAIPGFLYAFVIILLFDKNGIVSQIFGFSPLDPFSVKGLIVTQVTGFLPLAVLAQVPAFTLYSRGWEAVASTLGAAPSFRVASIFLPLNLPAFLTGWTLVALRSLSDFVSPMLLTSARFRLLVLEAYRDLAGSNWWSGACALSLELVFFVFILLIIERLSLRRERHYSQFHWGPLLSQSGRSFSFFPLACNLYGYSLLLCPLVVFGVLLLHSFSAGREWWGFFPSTWTFEHYHKVSSDALSSLGHTIILGLSVTALGVIGSWIAARARLENSRWSLFYFGLIPLAFALPSVIYAIGLVGTFNRPPLFLHFTPTLLILALLVARMNYMLQILNRAQQSAGVALEEVGRSFGSSSLFIFRWISLHYLKGAFVAGGILMFVAAAQDVAISVLIAPPRFYPLALVVARHVADGLFYEASALGVILMTLVLIVASRGFRSLISVREIGA